MRLTEHNHEKDFIFKIDKISSHLAKATIEINPKTVEAIRSQVITLYKSRISKNGFQNIPTLYLEENYKSEIDSSLKSFLLRYYVLDFLMNEIASHHISIANHPRLSHIEITNDHRALYSFDVSITAPINIREWKHFSFKSPKRKNYKDLDKQVSSFIKQEHELCKKHKEDIIESGDWICFDAILVDQAGRPVIKEYKNNLWLRINIDALTDPFIESFLGKKVGDSFLTNQLSLYENFEDETSGKHYFFITIFSHIKGSYCNLDIFKSMFRLKNKSDIHEKLVEVFSYRNDISQRKSIIEEMFNLFFSKHRFEIPKHLIIRKQEEILHSLKQKPDYQVYKLQKNFNDQVAVLAEKYLKEEVLIDQLAYHENIKTDIKDIQNYLNLFSNQRLREFVYFKPSYDTFEESGVPIHNSILKHFCRREKTLNHVLYHLMR